MANTLLTPQVIAQAALATLYDTTIMSQLVHRDYEDAFAGQVGDTITIRKPATFVALKYNRSAGITVQNATEGGIPMTLDTFLDVSFAVTTEDLTLKITDFATRLLNPAMEAINQRIDQELLALRTNVVNFVGTTSGATWDMPEALVDAGTVLTQHAVPSGNRSAVVGPVTSGQWKKSVLLKTANESGTTDGLREANIGARLFGFDAYESNQISVPTPGTGISTTEVGVAFHSTAFALAMRPLALPRGAVNAAVANYKGFGLRVIYGYDMDKKQDIISIDCLMGTKCLDPNRAVLIRGALG